MTRPRVIKHPWDRQMKESTRAYADFCAYLAMGPGRTVDGAARAVGKNVHTVRGTATRHKWVERSMAYESDVLAKAQAKQVDEYVDMVKRHMNAAKLLQAVGGKALSERFHRYEKDPNAAARMPTTSARQCLVDGIRLERTVRGEPDSVTETRTTEAEPANTQARERAAAALAKAAAMCGVDTARLSDSESAPIAETDQ
jgi:hypothetical protein